MGHGVLQTLYVMPEFWSRGIGSHASRPRSRIGFANRMSRRRASGRSPTTIERRAFYEKRGWSLTGRTRVVPYPPHPIDVEYARSTLRG